MAKSDYKEQSQGSLARDRVRRTSFWEQPWNPSCLKLKSGKHGCFNPELARNHKVDHVSCTDKGVSQK